jgi:transcriptional antiterminator RfaH
MPILPAEITTHPQNLFGDAGLAERRWSVLHTRPRQEKCLARELVELDLPFYLPVVSRRSLIRGKPVASHLPLFTSYLFLLTGEDKERVRALATHRVAHCLPVHDQAKLWHDLRQVHQLIESGAAVTPEQKLGPGAAVEIQSGPLAGLRGKILRTASGRRFIVQVDFIQQGASVLLDGYTVIRAED